MSFNMNNTVDNIIKKIINKEIKLELNGHFDNREMKNKDDLYFISDRLVSFISKAYIFNPPEVIDKMIDEKIDPMDTIFTKEKKKFTTQDCWVCGKRVRFYIEGKKIYADTECEYKDGFPEIEVEIDIPSGMLILYNDLRRFFPEPPDRYVNYLSEVKLHSEDYAKMGMIHIFTGNTCPSVYQVNDTHLIIGNDYSEDEKIKNIKGEVVGSICTDLWWYSAVDKDEFEKRAGITLDDFDKSEEKRGVWTRLDRVKLKPGRYKATGRHHLLGEWHEGLTHEIYSEITLVR